MSGCPQELFGLDCTHKCRCKNGTTCHQITGHCKEGCEPGRTGSSCQYQTYENIALGQPAFQSSDFEVKFMDGRKLCSSKYLATAGFAVDGKYNQNFQHKSCSRTQESSSKSYWYVILDRNYTINQIRIYAHSFFHYSLNVFVGDKNNPCSQLCYKSKSTETILHISCQRPLVGETVCIKTAKEYASLSLCEVEVIQCREGVYGPLCQHQNRSRRTISKTFPESTTGMPSERKLNIDAIVGCGVAFTAVVVVVAVILRLWMKRRQKQPVDVNDNKDLEMKLVK
ncbi:uncharacterized protein LOC115218139 isoform X2 [Octopus sinensis]|uniref:Uncharacterized protein LOC115218139 isoform X2 n=1 Tax=Octopus sinensis TaxID=2607531 RepID=A0A7E6F9H4_9MOLL|nr:uncharacterized protein LOC115218139 isoform X2 [Octopus sinensis]